MSASNPDASSGRETTMAPPSRPSSRPPSRPSSANDLLEVQWTDHNTVFSLAVSKLRSKHMYTDATLACDGQFYPVHKFVLSTCSEFFSAMFEWTPCVNPVLVLNQLSPKDLEAILDFMYTGSASVREVELESVVKAAQQLRIHGLACLDSNTRPVMHKDGAGSQSNSLCPPAQNSAHETLMPRDIKKSPDSRQAAEPPSKKRKPEMQLSNSLPPGVRQQPVSLPSIASLTPSAGDVKPFLHQTRPQANSRQFISPNTYNSSTNLMMSHSQMRSAAPQQLGSTSRPQFNPSSASAPQSSFSFHQPRDTSLPMAVGNNRQLQQLLSTPRPSPVEGANQLGGSFSGAVDQQTSSIEEMRKRQQLMQQKNAILQQQQNLQQQINRSMKIQTNNSQASVGNVHQSFVGHPLNQTQRNSLNKTTADHAQTSLTSMHQSSNQPQSLISSQIHSSQVMTLPQSHPSNQPHSQSTKHILTQSSSYQTRPSQLRLATPSLPSSHAMSQQTSQQILSKTYSHDDNKYHNAIPFDFTSHAPHTSQLGTSSVSIGANSNLNITSPVSQKDLKTHSIPSASPHSGGSSSECPSTVVLPNSSSSEEVSTTPQHVPPLPLTPMEQQIISSLELGGCDDNNIDSTKSPADVSEPNEEMLDVLQHSLYSFNEGEAKKREETSQSRVSTTSSQSVTDSTASTNEGQGSAAFRQTNNNNNDDKNKQTRSSSRSMTSTASLSPPLRRKMRSESEIEGCEPSTSSATVESAHASSDMTLVEEMSDVAVGGALARSRIKCPHCPKLFVKPESLSRHMDTHRNKEFACNVCNNISHSHEEFLKHKKFHQTKKCDYCDFATTRSNSLRKHMTYHINHSGEQSGEQGTKCDKCDFTSTSVVTLKHHIKNHHDSS